MRVINLSIIRYIKMSEETNSVTEEDRKYYRLTEEGEEELEEREEKMKEIGESSENMVLGFLNLYEDIFGKDRLDELLEKIRDEFDL